ncbi:MULTISPECIES: amidase family protein [Amycolatopsis]|uniref:amidase family protein n=1 Tax=Amycolatopsis TaxID=1813 RepID=UPI001C591948|nr:amidase [Amycolatopsis sp. TNS106]QXV56395.1 amidase [Amycolatopsis sp. TNS106]
MSAASRPLPSDPASSLNGYAENAGITYPDDRPELPDLLELPLAERCELHDRGEWDDRKWTEQNETWYSVADARYRAVTTRRTPSAGTPLIRVGVKDTIDVAGLPTSLGLRHYRHHPAATARALSRLAGVEDLVIGKVVSTELNIGVGSGCVNPWFPHIDPAGSSTGAGVSVAAHLCDLAMGTDVLGSVRWPAGHCGTVGLRMTHDPGLLHGIFPLSPPMDAVGWVARTAEDLAFLWQRLGMGSLLGSAGQPTPARYRIGVPANVRDGSCAPEMLETLDLVGAALADDGHDLADLRVDDELWQRRGDAWQLCARQAWDGYREWRHWITVPVHESTEQALEVGARVSDGQYTEILDAMHSCRQRNAARFGEHTHAWLLPLDPSPPPDLRTGRPVATTIPAPGEADYDRRIGYTPIASFAGLPAVAVPARLSRVNRAPLGVQIVGPPGSEERLIELARRVQRRLKPPGLRPA